MIFREFNDHIIFFYRFRTRCRNNFQFISTPRIQPVISVIKFVIDTEIYSTHISFLWKLFRVFDLESVNG